MEQLDNLRKRVRPLTSDEMASKMLPALVEEVRSTLLKKYPDNPDLKGCCDESIDMLYVLTKMLYNSPYFNAPTIRISDIHGEMKHTPEIKSDEWCNEHTWAKIVIGNDEKCVYVDITSGQFKRLFDDVPDFYVSSEKPRWYYPDHDNPAWSGVTRIINKKIKLKYRGHRCGIVEYCQHAIWGRISDVIHHIFYKK